MSIRRAYQTLENRDIHKIEQDGPFRCERKNAWLGEGYYFWDSFISIAHWWGKEGAKYKSGYVICESSFELNDNKCFNLVDNHEHLEQFNATKLILKENRLYQEGKTTVARIISFIKEIKVFHFEAIRVYGINSIGFNSAFSNKTVFVSYRDSRSSQYLDSAPAIQINFFTKNSLNRKGFNIIYPQEYAKGYLV